MLFRSSACSFNRHEEKKNRLVLSVFARELEVNLSNVKQEEGTEPFVVINAGKAGYTGSVTITKITFVK